MAELTEKYDQYRRMNDLDSYFAKNLSQESRENVLENIKSLMQKTDWHAFDHSIAEMS